MSGPEFFQTKMGRMFYEGTMPELVRQIKRLNDNLEADQPIPFVPSSKAKRDREGVGVGHAGHADRMPQCPHCQVALVQDGNDAKGLHHCPKCSSSFQSVKVRCDDCGWKGMARELGVQLESIPDLAARLDPGGEVPVGECPECGALAYHERAYNKMWEHIDHLEMLEIAVYPPGDNVTVECTKCGCVVHELLNSEFESRQDRPEGGIRSADQREELADAETTPE